MMGTCGRKEDMKRAVEPLTVGAMIALALVSLAVCTADRQIAPADVKTDGSV
jgi:hypothetical protein